MREVEVGEVFVELDASGARADRPLWLEAIARAESGESGGVIVASLDRFGRSLLDAVLAVQRIHQAGAV